MFFFIVVFDTQQTIVKSDSVSLNLRKAILNNIYTFIDYYDKA